jgi:acyl transferase domain-containing protein/SAM-dependent methyltransferase
MAGRFPGAEELEGFWDNLKNGVESISFFDEREPESADPGGHGTGASDLVNAGGMIEGVELFDAEFFGYSPREAELMDPQQRLFLEHAWRALESAGYDPKAYPGAVGVYAGAGINHYLFQLLSRQGEAPDVDDFQLMLLNNRDFLTTRVSYKLNLKGPSLNVQTACSTSLVAVQQACLSLLSYQCDAALAGGVSLRIPRRRGYLYREGMILSPDGHCRAFDAGGKGTVPGEGVGVVVLKRLEDAVADRDHIHAVIKGAAINNDGFLKVGFTAPSEEGQMGAIVSAHVLAGFEPDTISYVEAHGTGTRLGDPIEIAALRQAFASPNERRNSCAIGSVKTNIGHLDAAAGVAGLIKTVLSLEHGLLPPSLHYRRPNPEIDFASGPFYVNTELREWKESPRRAGVSSFGFGGTNAHLVLEEAPALEVENAGQPPGRWHVLPLSARSEASLNQSAARLAAHLERHTDISMADVAYTLQQGRHSFAHRCAVVCQNREGAIDALRDARNALRFVGVAGASETPVVFMIAGEGSQHPGMMRRLYETEPVFREELDECARLLRPHLAVELRELLYGAAGDVSSRDGGPEGDDRRLHDVQYMQPALFAVSYALAKLWMSWGVHPSALDGHGVGEYVAACLSGVFSLRDALALVAHKGALLQSGPRGRMLSVEAAQESVRPLLDDGLSVSAVNAPDLCVVSGSPESIEALSLSLGREGIASHALSTSHALHHPVAESARADLLKLVGEVEKNQPSIPLVANMNGDWLGEAESKTAQYWSRQAWQPVLFSEGLSRLAEVGQPVLLEIGPANTLSLAAARHPSGARSPLITSSLSDLSAGEPEDLSLAKAFAGLWACGVGGDWARYNADGNARRTPLPTYAFERQRYWLQPDRKKSVEAVAAANANAHANGGGPQPRSSLSDWFTVPSWKRGNAVRVPEGTEERCWLVFCDAVGAGRTLVERLRRAGLQVIAVESGERFSIEGDGEYILNAGSADEYRQLFAALGEAKKIPTDVLHLLSVSEFTTERARLPLSTDAGRREYESLLYLAQALVMQGGDSAVRLTVVASNLFEVMEEDAVDPEKATILGPCRVIPQEFENIACRCIDIGGFRAGDAGDGLFRQLLEEVTGSPEEPVVALRHGHRWIQSLEPLRLGAGQQGLRRLRKKGVYLITGGLGGVGLLLAEYLAKKVQARLILLSRRGLPPSHAESGDTARGTMPAPPHHAAPSGQPQGAQGTGAGFRLARDNSFVEGLERDARGRFDGLKGDEFAGLKETLKRLCGSYVYQYMAASGLDFGKGEQLSTSNLRDSLRIHARFRRFSQFMLEALAEDGIVEQRNGTLTFLKGPDEVEPSVELLRGLRERYPQFGRFYELLDYCVRQYPSVLEGTTPGIDVLFPGGQTDFLETSLRDLAGLIESQVYKQVVAGLLSKLGDANRAEPLRILEVGAGTGLLTKHLLPALRGRRVEYHFTDISSSFLIAAQSWMTEEDRSILRFSRLDISRDPAAQGLEANSFDIVIGLDVVHATPDISQTIGNLRTLLRPGGLLCLIEMIRKQRWIDMIWGLTDGWWHFDDFRRENNSALASAREWEQTLSAHEFDACAVYPNTERERESAEYGLILAQTAGDDSRAPSRTSGTFEDARRGDENATAISREIRRLEQLGAEVLVARADVSDPLQLALVLEEARRRFGAINGVIHAAGVPGGAMILGQTAGTAEAVFRSKVNGTLALHGLFAEEELDFFLLWSSISSFTGGFGQVAYTAASAFLDAYAHSQRRRKRFTCSVNWPLWNAVGTAVPVQQRHLELTGEAQRGDVITPEEALRAFARVLDAEAVSQVAVTPVDLGTLVERFKHFSAPSAPGDAIIPRALHARPNLTSAYVPPRDEVERRVAAVWSEALGVEGLGRDDNFFELGGDSLVAIKIIFQLKQAENVDLPVVVMFERPTVARLAELIRGDASDEGLFEEVEDLQQKRKAARSRRNKSELLGDE